MNKISKFFYHIKNIKINNSVILFIILLSMIIASSCFLYFFNRDNANLTSGVSFDPDPLIDEMNLINELDIAGFQSFEIKKDFFIQLLNIIKGTMIFEESAYETITLNSVPTVHIRGYSKHIAVVSILGRDELPKSFYAFLCLKLK